MTAPTTEGQTKTFTATLNERASKLGITPGDRLKFRSTSGERFPAVVDSVDDKAVTLRYPATRTDTPDTSSPSIDFLIDFYETPNGDEPCANGEPNDHDW